MGARRGNQAAPDLSEQDSPHGGDQNAPQWIAIKLTPTYGGASWVTAQPEKKQTPHASGFANMFRPMYSKLVFIIWTPFGLISVFL